MTIISNVITAKTHFNAVKVAVKLQIVSNFVGYFTSIATIPEFSKISNQLIKKGTKLK